MRSSGAVLAVLLASTSASALERGDKCVLKSPLPVTMRGSAGNVDTTLDPGTAIEVIGVSECTSTSACSSRIRAGDVKGDVSSADLEGACAGTLRMCRLTSAVMMYKENRSDSQAFRIKPGASVSIIKRGKTWAAVRVEDLKGFVKTEEITGACVNESYGVGGGGGDDDGGDDGAGPDDVGPTEAVERGDGPGLLFIPWYVEGAAPLGNADVFADALYARAAFYRPDAGRLAADGKRDGTLKQQIAAAALRAKRAETAFVMIGRMSVDTSPPPPRPPPKPNEFASPTETPATDSALEERYIVQLALVDAKSAKVVKGIRIRPSTRPEDDWAERALASLLPAMPSAPGSKLPVPAVKPTLEMAPNPGAKTGDASANGSGAGTGTGEPRFAEPAPWFANLWGYLAFVVAAGAGTGSAFVGLQALDDNALANASSQADPARAQHRSDALTNAIAADALGVVAAGAAVTGIVVFATRAGLDG